MRKASIITPTKGREKYLPLLHEVISKQSYAEWEWLIHDHNDEVPAYFQNLKNPHIHYFHSPENLTIGEKRNFLCERATGDTIFHFDDDDYYAPDYLQKGMQELQQFDFITLSSWFCAHVPTKKFFYWDKESVEKSHFVLDPLSGISQKTFSFENENEREAFIEKNRFGYGFCYAYKREVFQKVHFEKTNFDEDYLFFEKAKKSGFKIHAEKDLSGKVIHMMHELNTTRSFPQYTLPLFMMFQFFPELDHYLEKYP